MAAMSQAAPRSRGLFVVLDGVDGCGKSTQAARLTARIAGLGGKAPLHVREPGTTPLGERIRALLLSRDSEISPACEVLLFAAARRASLDQVIAPALASGSDVVCERFHASTFAYQAVAGGVGERQVMDLLTTWAGAPRPDLTLILDLPPSSAGARRGRPSDRIEDRGLNFQLAVADGFRRYSKIDPSARLIDASGDVDSVAARIEAAVAEARDGVRRG